LNVRALPALLLIPLLTAISACGGEEEEEETAPPQPPPTSTSACAPAERLEGDVCIPPGVPPENCAAGFEPDGAQGCVAVLPPQPCGDGLMAIPGETTCREVAPCGTGTWGDIPVESSTQYVDASYQVGDSDGSMSKPWSTIAEGLVAAAPGAIVAVAAGSYVDSLAIQTKPVRLWGRCPSMVELVGTAPANQTIIIRSGADGAEIRDLAVTGSNIGIGMSGSQGIVIDRVWSHDNFFTGIEALDVLGPTSVELSRSLIERNPNVGVHVGGATITVRESNVRDTIVQSGVDGGMGISVEENPTTFTPADLTVLSTVVERHNSVGINVLGSTALVEATVVRDGAPEPNGGFGRGMSVESGDVSFARASITLRTSVIERNHEGAIFIGGSDGFIEDSVFRDTYVQASDGQFGDAVSTVPEPTMGIPAYIELRRSLIERAVRIGASLWSDALVEGVVIRDIAPDVRWKGIGIGLTIQNQSQFGLAPHGSISHTAIQRTHAAGIWLFGSEMSVSNIHVSESRPRGDGLFGDGIASQWWFDAPSVLNLDGAVIESSARVGVASFGANVRLSDSQLHCNEIPLTGESFEGVQFAFEDAGGNDCGCGEAAEECKLVSAGVEAPEAPDR
jgi:hypothetical protein